MCGLKMNNKNQGVDHLEMIIVNFMVFLLSSKYDKELYMFIDKPPRIICHNHLVLLENKDKSSSFENNNNKCFKSDQLHSTGVKTTHSVVYLLSSMPTAHYNIFPSNFTIFHSLYTLLQLNLFSPNLYSFITKITRKKFDQITKVPIFGFISTSNLSFTIIIHEHFNFFNTMYINRENIKKIVYIRCFLKIT